MKAYRIGVFAFIFSISFYIISCGDTSNAVQNYDIKEYVLNASDYARAEAQFMEQIIALETVLPTKAEVNQVEQWIILNTNNQANILRDMTREDIMDFFLTYTTFSRDQLNTTMQRVDTVGKYPIIIVLGEGSYSVLFIEKI